MELPNRGLWDLHSRKLVKPERSGASSRAVDAGELGPFLISENCAGCVESGERMGGVGPQTVWDPEATESVPSYMERVACAAQLFCLAELKERVSLDRTNRTIA